MQVTLKDVAEEVGISISTVSRALNPAQTGKVKQSTMIQINQAIKKLGYVHSEEIIQNYYSGNTIGIVLASASKSFSHLLFAEMLEYLEDEIQKNNYSTRYIVSESKTDRSALMKKICENPVSGVIVLGPVGSDLLDFLRQNVRNIVYTGVNLLDSDIDTVTSNGYEATTALFDHFYSLDYRKIAFLGTQYSRAYPDREHTRFLGYKHCLEKRNLPYEQQFVQDCQDTTDDGYTAMYKLLSRSSLPDAIICTGDSIAIGAIRAAKENTVKIPEQIALAGMDNIKLAQYLVPSLTTVNMPKAELCNLAFHVLKDKIENKQSENTHLKLPFHLVIRESCGYKLK